MGRGDGAREVLHLEGEKVFSFMTLFAGKGNWIEVAVGGRAG